MRNRIANLLMLAVIMSGLLAACDKPISTPDKPDRSPQAATLERRGSYTLSGDTLMLTWAAHELPVCQGDTLRMMPVRASTQAYRVIPGKDTLRLATLILGTAPVTEWSVRFDLFLLRLEDGTGLEGPWRSLGWREIIATGNPPDSMRTLIANTNAIMALVSEIAVWEVAFRAGEFWSGEKTDFAAHNVTYWEGRFHPSGAEPFPQYAIKVRTLAFNRMEYKGLKTGETVVATYSEDGKRITYVSDVPAHPTFSVGPKDGACPAAPAVDWMAEFYEKNIRDDCITTQPDILETPCSA